MQTIEGIKKLSLPNAKRHATEQITPTSEDI